MQNTPNNKKIYLCAINNIMSGICGEDCKFCSQSIRYHADVERYKFKAIHKVVREAKIAKQNGAIGYCLVTAQRGLNNKSVDFIARLASAIKKEVKDINIIGSNGLATIEQLKFLKKHGVDSYNHNLESSKDFYKTICTTHTWEDRYQTCVNAREAGMQICTGGVMGMGENLHDREELIKAIATLKPESVPLNFFIPNVALPIRERNIVRQEALDMIKYTRSILGNETMLMIAGGREFLFKGFEKDMFEAGSNSIVIGDYLTTKGESAEYDLNIIAKLGYTVATDCEKEDPIINTCNITKVVNAL